MPNMNRIYIDTDLNDETALQNYFEGGYDASQYSGSLEEAREEMAQWVKRGWATAEQTEENFQEVTAEQMQELIKEFIIRD